VTLVVLIGLGARVPIANGLTAVPPPVGEAPSGFDATAAQAKKVEVKTAA
jgi:hypothetical protein